MAPSSAERDNVNCKDKENDAFVMKSKHNGPMSSVDSFLSKEKSLPNGEFLTEMRVDSPPVKDAELVPELNNDTNKIDNLAKDSDIHVGNTSEKSESKVCPELPVTGHSVERSNQIEEKKFKDLENVSIEEDVEHGKLSTKLDVESAKYLMSMDSKDGSDVGASPSCSDLVELDDSVNSVTEGNSSFLESNISESVQKCVALSGEEESGSKEITRNVKVTEENVESEMIKDMGDHDLKKFSGEGGQEDKEKVKGESGQEDKEKLKEVSAQEDKEKLKEESDHGVKGKICGEMDHEKEHASEERVRKEENMETDKEVKSQLKQQECSLNEVSSEKTNSVENDCKEGISEKSRNNNANMGEGLTSEKEEKSIETVDKVKDIDGSDILITINEDSDKDDDPPNDKKISLNPTPHTQQMPRVTSTLKDDVVIVDLSDDRPSQPVPPAPPAGPIKPGMVTVGQNGQQYVQHVIHCLDGRKQIIQVPMTTSAVMHPPKGTGLYTSLLNKAVANSVSHSAPKQKPEVQDFIHPDDLIPQSSWEQLALVQFEASQKKFDNTFWNGSCPVKSDISSMTKFLQDLGGDIVKQSAYSQIVHVQGRKCDQGKLGDKEKENLERMKKVVKELKDRYKHLELNTERCAGCNFVTESKNVMAFHKEHPHMDPPLDAFGTLKCPRDGCEFSTTVSPEAFAVHMEKEHSVKARIYDKPDPYKCHLCYFEAKAKSYLTRHRFKCDKQFKLSQNLHPNYTDINYCMKNIMYKSQIEAKKARTKPVPPAPKQPIHPPLIRPKIVMTKPTAPMMLQQGPRNTQVPIMIPLSQAQMGHFTLQRGVRPGTQPVLVSMSQNMVTKPPPQTVGELLKKQQQGLGRPVVPRPSVPASQQAGFEVCEICGGYVKDRMSLQIHFYYAHKVDLPAVIFQKNNPQFRCNVCQAPFWTAMGLTKHRQSSRHFDTVIQGPKTEVRCWICFQQPENLYSHLQSAHQMTTNECMILRRCMFCAIQTRTRKDLEMHMASAHGILIKGAPTTASAASSHPTKPQGVRNNFCVFCSKQFPDNTQLTLHCLRDHATCSGCGMVVARAADLAKHVCKSAGRKCPICGLKNLKQAFYNKHIRTHVKKCSVKIKRLTERQIEKAMGKERKAEMDLAKQREIFTKLESEIWDEIQSRRKRDEMDTTSTNSRKRKSNESDKSANKKVKSEGSENDVVVVE